MKRLVFQIHRLIQAANQRSLNAQGAVAPTVGGRGTLKRESRAGCLLAPDSGERERESERGRERAPIEHSQKSSIAISHKPHASPIGARERASERERARMRKRASQKESERASISLTQLMLSHTAHALSHPSRLTSHDSHYRGKGRDGGIRGEEGRDGGRERGREIAPIEGKAM